MSRSYQGFWFEMGLGGQDHGGARGKNAVRRVEAHLWPPSSFLASSLVLRGVAGAGALSLYDLFQEKVSFHPFPSISPSSPVSSTFLFLTTAPVPSSSRLSQIFGKVYSGGSG